MRRRHQRARLQRTTELLPDHHQVDQRLRGHAPPAVLLRHEQRRPPELGTFAPHVAHEHFGRLEARADLRDGIAPFEEAACARAQQLLVVVEPEIHAQTFRSSVAQYSSRRCRL